ncbi:hemolysin activation/secretion protein [Collimonas sp. OK607]|uniref:hypothetical protein n=1 Tax=Collimonas sp. OK607 TaxID=1798194 RepID=UPI0008E361CC|nr:hypothetical protein [Collimonas sp. OK607]SFB14102.1 hemolysin activation/secretion protein [Collimonas sp. OK607]
MSKNTFADKGDGRLLCFAKGIGLTILLAATMQNGIAQTAVTERDASEGLRRQEERTREQQMQLQPKADVLSPPTSTKISIDLPVESPCFVIREVTLSGKSIGRFS